MRRHRRLVLLLCTLVFVGGLLAFDSDDKRNASLAIRQVPQSEPTKAKSNSKQYDRTSEEPVITLQTIRSRQIAETPSVDAFPSKDWTPLPPPLPPPPPPPPPPAPQAPPLPFVFLGKQFDGSDWTIFLARQEYTYVIRVGDFIEGTYHVDKIIPPLLTLTYLPLNQQQTLTISITP